MNHLKPQKLRLSNTILSIFFFYFFIIGLYFLITAVATQIFNLIAELVLSIGTTIKKAKAKMEKHPVIVEITMKLQLVYDQCNSKLHSLHFRICYKYQKEVMVYN